jgi:FtsP/CotA-like multicopper oxidase with cupredoxin domain
MKHPHIYQVISMVGLFLGGIVVAPLLLSAHARGATPGIKGTSFDLTAQANYISQPDGQSIYSWGYGCRGTQLNFVPLMPNATCPTMQIPGPTLIVSEGDTITVALTNNLPAAAGNTSILFPGFQVTTTGGVPGLLTREAAPGATVSYQFVAGSPGTHSYYSGTQGDLQVEMGLYGAVIVLPTKTSTFASFCSPASGTLNDKAKAYRGEKDFRLAPAAYDHASACYDREYLFQFSEMDPKIHRLAEMAVTNSGCSAGSCPALNVQTEPYHPTYFLVNGRSMPDDMDPNYAVEYPHQPYNGNPHMHPGELVLVRVIGQGRWQHPFHEHGNHVRVLGRDGNLILSQNDATKLAGPLLFTTTTTPGLAMDGIFYWTGKGLNWDVYGHNKADAVGSSANLPCVADANGYNTVGTASLPAYQQINYYEWCADHTKPLEKFPFGDVEGGGPMTLTDPNYLTNGAWYGGSAYLGPDATVRAVGPKGTTLPSGTIANPPGTEAGFAFMWHSHNEREITTNNVFPGGMMMMMLVDSREFLIDESN